MLPPSFRRGGEYERYLPALAVAFVLLGLMLVAVALAAGAAKELWDVAGPGDASWRDFTWDVVGTATGVAVAFAIYAALRRAVPHLNLAFRKLTVFGQ